MNHKLAAILLVCAPALIQTPPAPQQLTSAHKLFITNTSNANNALVQQGYTDFYSSLSKLSTYQIVGKPDDADIIVAFSALPDGSPTALVLQLKMLDPKTQTVLWSLAEDAYNIYTTKSQQTKILARTADQLAEDFDAAVQQRPVVHSQKKGRFQQEQD